VGNWKCDSGLGGWTGRMSRGGAAIRAYAKKKLRGLAVSDDHGDEAYVGRTGRGRSGTL